MLPRGLRIYCDDINILYYFNILYYKNKNFKFIACKAVFHFLKNKNSIAIYIYI